MNRFLNTNLGEKKAAAVSRFSSGETLIEAIIAISILMFVLGPASALFVSSIRTMSQNRNDLVAAALAEEGVEIVRNIRDTNLIRFSQKSTSCWNTKPDPAITLANCDQAGNKIADADTTPRIYNLLLNPDSQQWSLDAGVLTDPVPAIANYLLSYDTATQTDPECPANGSPCHTHTGLYFYPDAAVIGNPPTPRGSLSLFYRQVQIEYMDLDLLGAPFEGMKVISTAQYNAPTGVRQIKRALILTNYPSK